MDWDSYYEKFYDWATSTQIKKMSSLTSFGASAEVSEVAQEYMDEKAASRLIKKAVAYGVHFTPDEINAPLRRSSWKTFGVPQTMKFLSL